MDATNLIDNVVNELMKLWLAESKNISVSELEMKDRLIAGGAAGLGYWMSVFPLDVVKVSTVHYSR